MYTIVETPTFQRLWPAYWTEEERAEFASVIARAPDSGKVIRNTGGVRKIRWARHGSGKSGGVRIIYYNVLTSGYIVLLYMYAKNEFDVIAEAKIRELRYAIEQAYGC